MHAPPEPDLTRLAEAFQAQRERSGMTFDELAAASGLARQTLLNLSAGRVHGDLRTWVILAKVWDVSLDELVAPIWDGHPQWLLDVEEQITAEDRTEDDRRRGEPEITTSEGFADLPVRPRGKKPQRSRKG